VICFLDEAKARIVPIKNVDDVLKLMKNGGTLRQMLPELNKIVYIILVLPVSSCTSERSFCALGRIETYVWSTINQTPLIDISIVHVRRDEEINLELVANQFIDNSKVRKNTFFVQNT
jgi:hypothetical protein